jgi:hypothetical protein
MTDSKDNDSPIDRSPRAAPAQRWNAPDLQEPAGRGWWRTLLITAATAAAAVVAVLKLDPTMRKPGQAPCLRLTKVTAALNAANSAPSSDVESLARVGLNRFTDGARLCVAGDIPGAIRTVQTGLDERAAATDALDHALTGH